MREQKEEYWNNFETHYKGHIGESSILCTDSHKSYIKFAIDFNLDHAHSNN